ncbi:FAD-binding protein [Mastigocoleus testarum]|uniref:FAD-binding PCMH-type domain-containing protein n=1 Tax=Mastigocoleus testarum BC008 TaxID=371196 RepID=A0A0V8A1A0_9CYAN|nr:FAD-binding protein [Mastigocoleus testarum]KST65367.1 hypothetical protein BC008_21460 [Mastigocoleus testarum BC008]KST70431.1 hypothetical protein BC008_45415 [Mastigocoleus testarum BC008]
MNTGRIKRRDILIGTTATIGVIAFDPVEKLWITDVQAQSTSSITIPNLDGQLLLDPESLAAVADDFGHIIKKTPMAVLQPGSKRDIAKIIRYANRFGIKVAMRGQGHTTYGQAQVDAGVVIDSKTLNKIHHISSTQVIVEPGVLILDLLKATLAQGLTPKVFPDYLGLSVGGLLQVGGIGGHTQKFGLFADNVLEVQAILGKGVSTVSSLNKKPSLFNSLIGGLGQFGIITQTTLPLIGAPTHARVYQLSYTSLQQYIADQNQAVTDGRFNYLEGQVIANPSSTTGWTYLLEAASYYTPPQAPSDSLLDGLSPDGGTTIDEFSYFDWQNRLAPLVAALQESGVWQFPHPWLDLFIPNSKVESYIHQVLQNLKSTDVNGPILLYPFLRSKLTRPFIKVPSEEIIYLFSILRTAPSDDPNTVQAMVAANRSLFEQARDQGGKSYRISAFPFSPQDWIEHFARSWNKFRRQKVSLDPKNILTPGQGIFNQ